MPSPLQDVADLLIRRETALEIGRGSHSRSELAMLLAGTSDKRSKPYKAALRNLERYEAAQGKQRRTPKPGTLEKLAGELRTDDRAIETAIEREPSGSTYVVHFDGTLCISEDCRDRHPTYRVSKQELLNVARAPGEAQGLVLISPYVGADRVTGTFSIRRF